MNTNFDAIFFVCFRLNDVVANLWRIRSVKNDNFFGN